MIHDRTVRKYHAAVVKGRVDKAGTLGGVLEKDEKANKVTIKDAGEGKEIYTIYEPAGYADGLTLLSIELVTGKTHQIKAHNGRYRASAFRRCQVPGTGALTKNQKRGEDAKLCMRKEWYFPCCGDSRGRSKKGKGPCFFRKNHRIPSAGGVSPVGF